MRTDLTRPMTFFVVGMPRGGTTIVARVFNSLADGFCLGEPHWYWQSRTKNMEAVQEACFGKVDGYVDADLDVHELLGWIQYRLQQGDYRLGGYKETWFVNNPLVKPITEEHKDRVDFFLVVFRHPVLVHSSQWALGWTEAASTNTIIEGYKELDILAQHPRAIPIVYERFAPNPLPYLNERLPFSIEGALTLAPTGHEYGDPYANRANVIEVRQRDVCLPPQVVAQHEETAALWAKWSAL